MPPLSDGEFEGIFLPELPDLPPYTDLETPEFDASPLPMANHSRCVTPNNEPTTPSGSDTSNEVSATSPPMNTISHEVALSKDHPLKNMLTPLHSGIQTRA